MEPECERQRPGGWRGDHEAVVAVGVGVSVGGAAGE
jgi:hypothetical protein